MPCAYRLPSSLLLPMPPNTRGRGEAEVYLKLQRESQNNAYVSTQSPILELLAQAESRRREELMRSLDPLVKVGSPCSCGVISKGRLDVHRKGGLLVVALMFCGACFTHTAGGHYEIHPLFPTMYSHRSRRSTSLR